MDTSEHDKPQPAPQIDWQRTVDNVVAQLEAAANSVKDSEGEGDG